MDYNTNLIKAQMFMASVCLYSTGHWIGASVLVLVLFLAAITEG